MLNCLDWISVHLGLIISFWSFWWVLKKTRKRKREEGKRERVEGRDRGTGKYVTYNLEIDF